MSLNIGFLRIGEYIGVSFENTLLIIIMFGGMIFYAKDFKLGVVMQLIGSGLLFMLLYALGLNWSPALICFFITIVIMSLSIYSVSKNSPTGFI